VQGGTQLIVTLIVIGTVFYRTVEGWSWLDAVYFSVVTIATVGYGDITPQTAIGKIFTIGYIFLGDRDIRSGGNSPRPGHAASQTARPRLTDGGAT
jgi:voltage-gated potassium channel Kch